MHCLATQESTHSCIWITHPTIIPCVFFSVSVQFCFACVSSSFVSVAFFVLLSFVDPVGPRYKPSSLLCFLCHNSFCALDFLGLFFNPEDAQIQAGAAQAEDGRI